MRNVIQVVGGLAAVAFGVGLCTTAQASSCTPSSTVTCYTFTVAGGSGAPVPFGSVSVTQSGTGVGETLTFLVDVSPNYSIGTGSHYAFSFAIGNTSGVLTDNLGSITSLTQPGNGQTYTAVDNHNDNNPPFNGTFNEEIDCSSNGGSTNCGQTLSFTYTFTSPGELIASPGSGTGLYFAADVCVPKDGGGCSSTGVAGATQSTVAVPVPLAGAGLPGLVAACIGLFALARRRRRQLVA